MWKKKVVPRNIASNSSFLGFFLVQSSFIYINSIKQLKLTRLLVPNTSQLKKKKNNIWKNNIVPTTRLLLRTTFHALGRIDPDCVNLNHMLHKRQNEHDVFIILGTIRD